MADLIRVSPEQLRNTAATFEEKATSIQNTTNSISDMRSELSGDTFSGEAADAFNEKLGSMTENVTSLLEEVRKYKDALEEIANNFESSDSTAAGTAQSLNENIV